MILGKITTFFHSIIPFVYSSPSPPSSPILIFIRLSTSRRRGYSNMMWTALFWHFAHKHFGWSIPVPCDPTATLWHHKFLRQLLNWSPKQHGTQYVTWKWKYRNVVQSYGQLRQTISDRMHCCGCVCLKREQKRWQKAQLATDHVTTQNNKWRTV